jgi:PAS domain-containing protein
MTRRRRRVLLVCSYGRKTIRDERGGPACDVSHGMCPSCADHFERLWKGMPLSEYLDTLPQPVLVVNGDGCVVAANQKLAALFGRDRVELRGLRGGEAMACVHSRLPEGCGKTVHCRECTIRRAVAKVAKTGVAQKRVPAYLQTKDGRVDLRISAKARDGLVHVTVEEARPAQPKTAEA